MPRVTLALGEDGLFLSLRDENGKMIWSAP